MHLNQVSLTTLKRIAQTLATVSTCLGLAALIGWFTGLNTLKAFSDGYIPMAPNTAFLFVVLSTVLILVAAERLLILARTLTAVSLVLVTTRLSEYLTGYDLGVDRWFFQFPAAQLGSAPIGKMAFLTAFTFGLMAIAALLLTFLESRVSNTLARALATIVVFIGAVFSLGYLYGNPLTYDWHAIPMALNTALCFCFSGTALLVKASERSVRERRATAEALQSAHDELEVRVKERTAELHAQQDFLRTVIDTSPNPIFVKDAEGRFTLVNKALADAYGTTIPEIVGCTEADFGGDDEEISVFVEDDAEVLQTLEPKFIPEEKLTNLKTQETRFFQTIKVPLKVAGSNAIQILGVAADITERKRAEEALLASEEQLRQAQRLESVGQLAGGIAHDFNNLLTVIGGYSDLLLEGNHLDQKSRESLYEVNKAAERAASLTRQLLAFSRKQVLQPRILDLNALVDGLGKMLRRLIGEHIEIITSLKSHIGKISADPGQIEQVIINLVVNARDAMPNGGTISIETANVELDEVYSEMHIAVKPGPYVMVAVSDTGVGMDSNTRKHIFEPFFTTKELGRGTGLGLSTIYGIVKQSGGNIWVYSEPEKGSTFKVYFPRVEVPTSVESSREESAKLIAAHETILLVEDEAIVRNLTRDILESAGYDVLVAESSSEALRICKDHQASIDLMLTDVVMPGMNGQQVSERAKVLRHDLNVLFMSGYTDDAIVRHGVLEPGTHFIEKPFTARALLSKVRETINAPASYMG